MRLPPAGAAAQDENMAHSFTLPVNGELNKALKAKDMGDKLATDGAAAAGGTPEQFGATIKRDIETWRKVVQMAGVKAE
jgi:tripartite-type tricarboxylate transporter receptor subunit TctC